MVCPACGGGTGFRVNEKAEEERTGWVIGRGSCRVTELYPEINHRLHTICQSNTELLVTHQRRMRTKRWLISLLPCQSVTWRCNSWPKKPIYIFEIHLYFWCNDILIHKCFNNINCFGCVFWLVHGPCKKVVHFIILMEILKIDLNAKWM